MTSERGELQRRLKQLDQTLANVKKQRKILIDEKIELERKLSHIRVQRRKK